LEELHPRVRAGAVGAQLQRIRDGHHACVPALEDRRRQRVARHPRQDEHEVTRRRAGRLVTRQRHDRGESDAHPSSACCRAHVVAVVEGMLPSFAQNLA
jgi:hypothetical protein